MAAATWFRKEALNKRQCQVLTGKLPKRCGHNQKVAPCMSKDVNCLDEGSVHFKNILGKLWASSEVYLHHFDDVTSSRIYPSTPETISNISNVVDRKYLKLHENAYKIHCL